MATNELPIYELYDVWFDPFWYKSWFWWVVGLTIVILAVLLIWFIVSRVKRRHAKKSAADWALNNLHDINPDAFEDPDMHKLFYVRLTGIMKQYFNEIHPLDFEGLTDQEVIQELKRMQRFEPYANQIAAIFDGAEEIKFAHQYAAKEKMRYDRMKSIDVIKRLQEDLKGDGQLAS